MEILFLSPNQTGRWNQGHQQFRDAIGKDHLCRYYGPKYPVFAENHNGVDVPQILQFYWDKKGWRPDVIMTYHWKYTLPFQGLGHIRIPKIHFLLDFTPFVPNKWSGTMHSYVPMIDRDRYDVYFALSYQVMDYFETVRPHDTIFYLPFGVDHRVFKPLDVPYRHDVFTGWSRVDGVYPTRPVIEDALKENFPAGKGYKLFIGRSFNQAYIRTLCASKIVMNAGNIYGTMNMKHFEVMATRTLMFTDYTREFQDLRFKNEEHCIIYQTIDDLVDKVRYYLDHPSQADKIAQAGYAKTLEGHTNQHRVETMFQRLADVL